MGKTRVRVKTGGKVRRWPKGHSSDSNPPVGKFRSKANGGFFKPLSQPGALTSDSLEKHNAILGTSETNLKDGEDGSVNSEAFSFNSFGQKSFNSFASGFTRCSLPSFESLLSSVRKDSPVYREMLAILAAVTDTVREKSENENTTEYFGALVSILECSEDGSVQQIAITSLLSMCIRHVPRPVLIEKFSFCSQVFVAKFEKVCNSGNVLLIKSLTECITHLLRAQTAVVWQESLTMKIFATLLDMVVHSKPKIRKAGQNCIIAILLGSACMKLDVEGPAVHPAAAEAARFCIRNIENCRVSGQTTTTLHVITLLHSVMVKFPKKELKSCVETLLKLMVPMAPMVKFNCFVALKNMVENKPDLSVFPPTVNAQLVSSLYDFQPSVSDVQLLPAWLALQKSAVVNLYNNNKSLSLPHVTHFFSCAVKCWTSSKNEIRQIVSDVLSAVIDDIVGYFDDEDSATIESCFSSLLKAMNYQYVTAWGDVLRTLKKFFEVCGFQSRAFVGPHLKTLVELRDTDDFCYVAELEAAIGAAVTSMGPKVLLDHVPLGISGDESDDTNFTRSWLLPILRISINGTDLSYFHEYFLPLSRALGNMSKCYSERNNMHLSKIYSTLESQIWDLFPGFCWGATDVTASFKKIAKTLGSYLTEKSERRLVIMTGLRNLITHSLVSDQAKAEVSRFSKNFLPILFNLYVTLPTAGAEQNQRAPTFQTVCSFLSISDESLINTLAGRCLEKVTLESESEDGRTYAFDLLRAMLPYMDASLLDRVWQITKQLLNSDTTHSQKSSYRLVEEMCNTNHEHCISFVKKVRFELISVLKESLAKSSSSSKSSRLNCISNLLDHLDECDESVLVEFMPEAVICCKEHNDKSRASAFSLLVKIGRTLQRWSGRDDDDEDEQQQQNSGVEAARKYLQLLLAGLTGSPHMIAATNLAIAQVVHQFKDIFPEDLLELIVENSCLLMSSSSREPVESCLSLTKSLVFAVERAVFTQHLPKLVKALSSMTDDCKRHFRLKVRDILSLFVRKFDYDVVAALIPKKDVILQKRLKTLKKIEQRNTAKRESKKEERVMQNRSASSLSLAKTRSVDDILHAADHSDDENDEPPKKGDNETWIKEDADSIVDLLDARASRHVTSSKPTCANFEDDSRRRSTASQFEFSKDGRLIVSDERKTSDKAQHSDDAEEMDDGVDKQAAFLEQMHLTSRKRKQRGMAMSAASSSRSVGPTSKMRALSSGCGIFRRTDVSSSRAPSVPGSEFSSSKGRGDMKRAGRPDPYAYVPLVRGSLNKRKQAKYKGQFKSVVLGAKKGADRGKKARFNAARRK